ncbi:MAG: hypothetical protein AAF679_06335 [Pseudomonadota bacterium]
MVKLRYTIGLSTVGTSTSAETGEPVNSHDTLSGTTLPVDLISLLHSPLALGLVGSIILIVCLVLYRRPRITQRLNTVNLGKDLDDIEMLMSIEETFGVKFEDSEKEKITTVGDVYDLVSQKLVPNADFDPNWELVCWIVRLHSGSSDPIDRATTFFPELAQKRDTGGPQ